MTLDRRRSVPRLLALLLVAAVAVIAVPAGAAAADRGTGGVTSRWIVAVARGDGSAIGGRASLVSPLPRARDGRGDPAARRQVQRILRANGIRPSVTYRHAFDGFAARLTSVQLAALRRDRAVAALIPDVPMRVEAGPLTPAGGSVIRTRLADPVMPTGIRRSNADAGPLSRIDGVDDPLDVDVAVIDTGIAPASDLRVAGGYDCSSDDPAAWRDREGHGTHVAGTIAARDDRRGVVGVAPGARLWAIKIFDDSGSGFLSTQLCGYDHVLGMRDPDDAGRPRIEVINLSIGYWLAGRDDRDCGRPSRDLVHGAICALVADGTTVVAAAGNQSVSTVTRQPAAYDEVITVSALADFDGRSGGVGRQDDVCPWYSRDTDDTYGDFSNFGPDVDLIAPGKCILSTVPGGWFAWSTGTSMATPHVAGAAALLAAAHPGARPSQIKAALVAAATFDWRTKTDPDGRPDPLLDVSRLGPLPDFSVRAADATDELAHGGVTRIDVTIERDGVGHAPIAVRAVDLPDGITAEVAPVPTTGSSVAIWLRADGSASNGEGSFTVRATDGDLVRTASASFRVRAGGPTIAFTAPDGGADGVRITDGDQATIAFTETDPGAPPVERRVLRQAGTPVTPGTCADVDWSAVGDPVTPGELDPGGSVEAGWSFTADLAEDGCTRWLVRLIDEDGGSARFASPAVLRDTRDPGKPAVTLEGEGVARAGTTVWVRGGTGSLVLIASGVDVGSGVASHTWGELSVPDGWSVEPGPGGDGSAITLSWGPEAADTTIGVRATDATGRTGPARTMALRVDGTGPRANGWFDPPSRTDRVSGSIVELGWRAIEDAESGPASLQRVQRQVAKPVRGACAGVAWTDDGPSRLVTPRDEQWDLRSGRCYRWILTPRDAVGNAGKPAVSGSVFVDLLAPKADFLAPDEGTVRVTTASRVRVAWTELRREGGGESFRTLERERVAAVGDTCPELGWVRQGAIDDGPSPSRSVGLKPGYCYRWRLNTSDSRDNVASELSGIVRVVAPEP